MTITKKNFADMIAKMRADKLAAQALVSAPAPVTQVISDVYDSAKEFEPTHSVTHATTLSELQSSSTTKLSESTDKYGNSITYNERQQEFVSLASTGQSAILIGAAGTGKTTCMKGVVSALIQHPKTRILQNHDHKHLLHGVPGIVVCAYTRRATNNIRRNMDEGMKGNCITIHKLLEYGPEYTTIIDDNGKEKTIMEFVPFRNALNPLPPEISCIVFEESSMISTALFAEVMAAIRHEVQIIFLGDIQQLPPVFGPAILGYKMLELPTVELTEVYRQALESPIIRLAHRILSGNTIKLDELSTDAWKFPGQLKITPWKKKIDFESALSVVTQLFTKLHNSGEYNPEEDMILIPFNKSLGTLEVNKSIANHLARLKERITWEVVAGFTKHYFSIDDKVLYDREDAVIMDIYPNPAYSGAKAQAESAYLDYWGHNSKPAGQVRHDSLGTEEDIDFLLAQVASNDSEDRVTQSSHYIKLKLLDSDTEKTLTKAAEVNNLILGYALTVHKAQGSEWDKVFILLHNSHSTMIQRELLYTAVTRAKKELFIICEGDTFVKGINSQRIKGNTLAEKAEYFKGKLDYKELQS